MSPSVRLPFLAIGSALLAASFPSAYSQLLASDCAVWEDLLTRAGYSYPWSTGKCCDYNAASGGFSISCTSNNQSSNGTYGPYSRIFAVEWITSSSYRRLNQEIPPLSTLTELEDLELRGAGLVGSLHDDLATLVKLRVLDFTNNLNLTGPLPNLSPLKNLTYFSCFNTSLSGSIDGLLPPLTSYYSRCYTRGSNLYSCNGSYPYYCSPCCDKLCPNPPPPSPPPPPIPISTGGPTYEDRVIARYAYVFVIVGLFVAIFVTACLVRLWRQARLALSNRGKPPSDQIALVNTSDTHASTSDALANTLDAPPPYSRSEPPVTSLLLVPTYTSQSLTGPGDRSTAVVNPPTDEEGTGSGSGDPSPKNLLPLVS
ncbi:hypothetical protein HDU93_007558 [Gonapodya sp. JEL0774]|nr:hypothetical protein HDU93_007558 [Gonapodya sp. JEL0774]